MAPKKRLGGAKNYLYIGTRGAEVTTGALVIGTWYKITAKAASASALPATSVVGDVFKLPAALTLVAGDKVVPFTLEKLAFVTNVPNSSSKEKFENTVQIDDVKSYVEGDKSEKSGTINGYFVVPDDTVKLIQRRFNRVVAYDAGTITYNDVAVGVLDFVLGRNETAVVGDVEVFEYMPSIVESLEMEKPMEGNQTFNFGYSVVGSERPSIHYRPITT
jgi:hypothetical protein